MTNSATAVVVVVAPVAMREAGREGGRKAGEGGMEGEREREREGRRERGAQLVVFPVVHVVCVCARAGTGGRANM